MSGRKATDRIIPGDYALSVNAADMAHPDHWVQVPLVDIARLESGHTPSRRHPEWWGGEVPWISIPDAREHHGETIQATKSYTNDDGLANSAARLLPEGTVCLSRTASVGYSTVMGRPMATSQDFVNWVCTDALDPHWLKHLFIAEENALKHRFGKGSTHTTIYYPEVKAFNVCLPPVDEQKRIVAKLDALQARSRRAREALDAIPALLDRFRQSVLAAAFRGDLTADWRAKNPDVEPASVLLTRIRAERKVRWIAAEAEKARARAQKRAEKKGQGWGPEEDAKALEAGRKKAEKKYTAPEPVDPEGLPELPKGWCWASISELTNAATPLCYGVVTPGAPEEGGVPLVRVCDLVGGSIAMGSLRTISPMVDQQYERSRLEGGEVLVSLVGTVGRVAVAPREARGSNIARALARLAVVQEHMPPWWLAHWLGSPVMQHRLLSDAREVARKTLNLTELRVAPVPVAPQEEMVAASQLLWRLLATVSVRMEAATAVAERVDVLDQAILAKAFRGELVPQDPNDEPASVLLERIRAEREAAPKTTGRRRSRSG